MTSGALRLEVSGLRSGPCLVLGNAMGTDRRLWVEQERTLASGSCVVRFDYPGHGGAEDWEYGSCSDIAHALLTALDALGLSHFVFCGISMGSAIGMELALIAPGRVRGLMLSNAAARFGTEELWSERIAQAEDTGVASLAESAVSRWLPPGPSGQDSAMVSELCNMFSATSPRGYIQACRAVSKFDVRKQIGSIDVPTLVVAGTYDMATTSSQALELHKGIVGSRYLEFPVGHLANIGSPAAFTAAMGQFINSIAQT